MRIRSGLFVRPGPTFSGTVSPRYHHTPPADQIPGLALIHELLLLEQEWEDIRAKRAYEEDYFFVSQLFEEKWQPRTTVL